MELPLKYELSVNLCDILQSKESDTSSKTKLISLNSISHNLPPRKMTQKHTPRSIGLAPVDPIRSDTMSET